MSWLDDIGVTGAFQKVAFTILSPVIVPLAVVGAAYEAVSGKKVFSDSTESSTNDEQEIRERVARETKERQAAKERKAIVAYAQNGMVTLLTSHTSTVEPVTTSLSFPQLRKAVRSTEPPLEILGQWMPQDTGSDIASGARKEIKRLCKEIKELRQLRQAILELQPEKEDA